MSTFINESYHRLGFTSGGVPPWRNCLSEIGCAKAPQDPVCYVVPSPSYGWSVTQPPFCASGLSESPLDTEREVFPDGMVDPSGIAMSECFYGPTSGTSWPNPEIEGDDDPFLPFENYLHSHPLYFDALDNFERPGQTPGPRKRANLTVRERARNENGKFFCSICKRRYARRERKETCQNNHAKEKTHHCQGECGVVDCKMSYASPDCLRRHQWTADQRRAFCPNCDSYTSKQNLARHKKRCQTRT